MPIYISMLRGINVGGNKKIKMEELRVSLERLGLEQVKTYIQSGNVVFKCGKISTGTLSKQIQRVILNDFGHSVSVIIRSAGELEKIIEDNPFLKESDLDIEKLHVTFLSEAPSTEALKKLDAVIAAQDRCIAVGAELYLYLPNGVSGSFLMKKPVDRILGVATTTRNWRTVNAVHRICVDCR